MSHTLVTFLGRPQLQVQDVRKRRYREATYRFPDGVDRTSAFFGLALAEYLKPDNVVVLGTCGSMWGVLASSLADASLADDQEDGIGEDDRIIKLLHAEDAGQVTQCLLDGVAHTMRSAIGREVKPQLIPFGKDAEEQYGILQVVSEAVPEGDVSFDLTHGFRHLGMVGFLSAFMLEGVGHLNVRGLWYGALDMTDRDSGITPVLELEGLNRVRRWVDALNRFDASGDYGVFAPLLKADGVPQDKAQHLKKAAFHERTSNLSGAAQEISSFLETLKPLPGASGLFQERLRGRLEWARGINRVEQQCKLAFEYLERHDFIRAAIFGWEALVRQECVRRQDGATDFDARTQAIYALKTEIKRGCHRSCWRREAEANAEGIHIHRPHNNGCRPNCKAFFRLRSIRHTLAHGDPPEDRDIQAILRDADRLKNELDTAIQRLLNGGGQT